ncbi:MAG TPA: hypothetical protein VGH74_17405, partial [Planctomycetaceae bacterium]
NMTFTAKAPGIVGNGITLVFTKSDLGANVGPSITVSGSQISIVLNTDATGATTATRLMTAINSDLIAGNIITASLTGNGTTNIAAQPITAATGSLSLIGGQGSRTIISRNDNYFGTDSFVNLHLAAGNYYVVVSAAGNTNFDPSIADSGFGGRTDGDYQLKMNFTPDPVGASYSTLNDAGLPNAAGSGGVALDGDGQNMPGGTFNYWFQSTSAGPGTQATVTGNTIFVDKANFADNNQDGSIADPYSTISQALQAATNFESNSSPGTITIIRIAGNGGGDANAATTGDSLAYLVGFDTQGNPQQDGSTFIVPQNVTVMIDEGAVLKLHSAIIDVGNTTPNINRAGGALQVLGTPRDNVTFTSLFNDAIGGRSDAHNFTGANPGDWGGLVFQQSGDFQGHDFKGSGVYLNSVNQAFFTYGGGQVIENAVLQVFDPIHISNPDPTAKYFDRPAVWFNTITLSADSALSADPNSFENSEDRSGPDVYGNLILRNSINGFFIRIRTNAGQPIDTLGVSARIEHTDVTYVLAENLFILGNAGGPYEPNPFDVTHTGWQARLGASLVLDPGVVLKLSGAHIEAQVGQSQFVAEGTASNPIIFTSLSDNSYGADGTGAGFTNVAGTFNTSNNPAAKPAAGDWGGIFYNADSSGSIDHAVVQYAGGLTTIAGGFASFNPIEIQQASVRVAETLFQFNAGGADFTDRNGLLSNDAATIFVRGAQPVIIDNIFIGNAGYIISVNANALNSDIVPDWGRSTGSLGAFGGFTDNHGPLVALNLETGNDFNGMEVRGEEVTTQTYWDDTDMVHIVTSEVDDVINQHTFGGITLESNATSSLVIKLSGATAGFAINGIPLDVTDRIGGTFQSVGTAAHPVIMTSLFDNTVGAGFQPNGQPLLKTVGTGAAPAAAAGDWAGINLGPYSNDRNVATAFEQQSTSTLDNNSTPGAAQALGALAPDLATDTQGSPQGGNDYQALGFAVHGTLNQPSDVDVYSFTAYAGTEVWFQIGLSSPALASVLELVDSNGNVLASSNASTGTNVLSGLALNMIKDPNFGGVFYSENPRDTGMRVVLPGAAGSNSTYYIRVRSDHGLTKGEYELQIRLRQQWESPGSVIQYSTVNYSTSGIQLNGLPNNSPLSGDSTSVGTNNSFNTAQNLGDMLTTNQSSIAVSGTLNSASQVDWYKFTLQYNLIESIASANSGDKTFSTIFDVNFAAGLARPDTTISVYDSTGTLILVSRDSNVGQPPETLSNLSSGSFSPLDPFIGAIQMPTGAPTSPSAPFTYFVAVSSNAQIPTALDGVINAGSLNQQVRLQPVDSVQRIVEDHIGFTGYTSGDKVLGVTAPVNPVDGAILPIDTTANVQSEIIPYALTDVVLFTINGAGDFGTANPFTGASEYMISNVGTAGNRNIQMRSDGTLWMYEGIPGDQNDVGQLVQLDPGTGAVLSGPTPDGIPKFTATTPPAVPDPNGINSDTIDSFTWVPNNAEPGGYSLYYAVEDVAQIWNPASVTSRLYRVQPTSLHTPVANTPYIVVGQIVTSLGDTATGTTNGMAVVGGTVYGVSSTGKFYTIGLGSGQVTYINTSGPGQLTAVLGAGVGFTGLALGPQNVNGGAYANLLFATTTSGKLVAFDTSGNVQAVFANGASTVGIGASGMGLAFSPLDFNLWHPTTQQKGVAGHGILPAFDQSNNAPASFGVTVGNTAGDSRKSDEGAGGASYYFGLENWSQAPPGVANGAYIEYQNAAGALTDAQYGIQTSAFQKALTSNGTVSTVAPNYGNTYNLPGGAHGTLVTDSFSLATYSSTDLPTLYINYLLQTDGTSSTTAMTDSARIWVSQDNGLSWQLVATNNLIFSKPGSPAFSSAELPSYLTESVADNLSDSAVASQVQPLFGTDTWRQVRIDLANYAGQANLRLRFDFDTSGTTYANSVVGPTTASINGFGAGPNKAVTGQNNNFAGWYIDDIIVGFANRGEIVTGATANNTGFTPLPVNPAFGAPAQALVGPYELNVRGGEIYGVSISSIASPIVIGQQFDDNQALVSGFTINAPAGNVLTDGQTFTISDGIRTVVFEFDSNNTLNVPTDRRVAFTATDTNVKVAETIRDAINAAQAAGKFTVIAQLTDGTITGTGSPTTSTDPNVRVTGAVSVTGIAQGPALNVVLIPTANPNPDSINEAGVNTTMTGHLTRPAGLPAQTVTLSVINVLTGGASTAATVTASVTFAANATISSNFTVTAVNNGQQDGTRTIAIVPSASGYTSSNATLDVIDDESPTLTLTVAANNTPPGSVKEGATGDITITRNTVAGLNTNALVVTLTSLDPTRLQVPATVTILAGQSSVTVTGAIQALVNGTKGDSANIGITASADGYASNTQTVQVVDQTAVATPRLNVPASNVDTTPTTAGNQTNGAIAIDPVASGFSSFGTSGVNAVHVGFAANSANFLGVDGNGIQLVFNKADLKEQTVFSVALQQFAGSNNVKDGDTFTVDDGTGPKTFQFFGNTVSLVPGNVPVPFTPITIAGGSTAAQVAASMATAISGQFGSITATAVGTNVVMTETGFTPVAALTQITNAEIAISHAANAPTVVTNALAKT